MTPTERLASLRALLAVGLTDDALDEAIGGLYRAGRVVGTKPRSPGAERQRRWRERLASVSSETPGDASETSRRDASETPRDVSRDASDEPRARSLETSPSLLGSGSDSQKEEQNQTPQPSVGPPMWAVSETPRETPRETPPRDAETRNAKPKRSRGYPCPPSDVDESIVRQFLAELKIPQLDDREHGANVRRFLDHHRARRTLFVDWAAAWRNWRDGRFVGGGAGRPPSTPRVQGGPQDLADYQRMRAERQALSPDDPILAEDIPF